MNEDYVDDDDVEGGTQDGSRGAALKRFIYIFNLVVFLMLIPHTSQNGTGRLTTRL